MTPIAPLVARILIRVALARLIRRKRGDPIPPCGMDFDHSQVVCPVCQPERYARAKAQAERAVARMARAEG